MSDPPYLYVVPPTLQIEEACIPGTRQTIFATIQTWLTSPDLSTSKVLWLADISGSGKSAVARHVAYTTTLQNQLLCSFFFKRDIEPQSSTSRVISTLAREIARTGGPITSEVAQSSKNASGLGYTEAFHTQITLPLCHHPPDGPALILIDALDESGTPAERAEFLAALVHEIPLLPDNVKLMVTSKPAQDIDDAFNKLSVAVSDEDDNDNEDDHEVYRLTFDVYGQENRRDLRRYISYTFDRVARVKRENGIKLPVNWPSNDERKSLVAHANGLFLWVSVAADYVACADDPQQALDKLLALQSRPSPEAAIDALYKHILRAAEESPDFNLPTYHDILDLVLASSNPITITEINLTLRRDAGPTIVCLRPVLSCEPVVRIVHQSFREYVRDAQKCESRFLITWGTPSIDANPPALVGSPALNPQRKGSFGSGLYPGFPLPSLATVASYPHAQHQAPDVSELIDIDSISPHPAARGAYGDIWRARYTDGTEIAIKSIRSSVTELVVWSRLKHPNVLGLLGICVFAGEIGMVSEWMPNGNVTDYTAKHSEVDKLKLILDVAAGLSYLHSNGIVHGDLKGGNVVISADGTGRLVDFGLARLTEESLGVSTTSTQSGTTRWMAHELISPAEGLKASPTFASDVYALGMEILTGHPPFNELRNDFQVMFAVIKGDLPQRPSVEGAPQLTDRLWELIEWCWHRDRERRPKAEVVYEMIKILYAQVNRKPKEVLVDLRGMSCQGGPGPNDSVGVPYPENDDEL